MNHHGIIYTFGMLIAVFSLTACQSDITLSKAVRRGDTVVVSLGNADPNGEYSNITTTLVREEDISASVRDSNSVTHPVRVRHVFRVYGDPTAVDARARQKAQWMAVIDLVNPTGSGKPHLALGAATLTLQSTAFIAPHIIRTEIISGVGSPHDLVSQNDPGDFGVDKIQFAKPAKQALIEVAGTLPQNTKLAGAEFRFSIPDVHGMDLFLNRLEPAAPAKLPSSQPVHLEFSRQEREAPTGTDVVVALTSTEGVDQSGLAAFNFVMLSDFGTIGDNPTYWQQHFSSAAFYDTEGQEIAGLTHVISENR